MLQNQNISDGQNDGGDTPSDVMIFLDLSEFMRPQLQVPIVQSPSGVSCSVSSPAILMLSSPACNSTV